MNIMNVFNTNDNFYRDFYYELEKFLQSDLNVFILTGPRKVGKSFALRQLVNKYSCNTTLIDFKQLNNDEHENAKNDIIKIIMQSATHNILLDEITYLEGADSFLASLDSLIDDTGSKCKLIITGSQQIAIRQWALRAFSNKARFLNARFLDYHEWLRYVKSNQVTEDTFKNFVLNVHTFSKFSNVRDYLESLLDETIVSNFKSNNVIFRNDVSDIAVEDLLNIMYCTLISLHNQLNCNSFHKKDRYLQDVKNYYVHKMFSTDELNKCIEDSIMQNYKKAINMNNEKFRRVIGFLLENGLITLTYVSIGEEDRFNLDDWLYDRKNNTIKTKNEFFSKVKMCSRYPMFYVAILRDTLKDRFPEDELPSRVLGGIVECYVRGILVSKYTTELHDVDDNEIDYVDYDAQEAIEITISNKKLSNVHLDLLGNSYKKILLTKDKDYTKEGLITVPYYEYIYKILKEL